MYSYVQPDLLVWEILISFKSKSTHKNNVFFFNHSSFEVIIKYYVGFLCYVMKICREKEI